MDSFTKDRWVGYLVFGLSVFLIFCLLFEPYIILPAGLAWIGRWHPLLVHFPIVLLLVAILLGLWNKKPSKLLVSVATISALLTAITGFFLGSGVADKGQLLISHQWLGGAVALMAAIWYGLYELKTNHTLLAVIPKLLLLVLIGFTGHYGGMVTHGEDYLALPSTNEFEKIPENPLLYKDVVYRILKANCMSCHNDNKRKGQLVMTTMEALLKGGESGNTLIPGDPENSEMIRRLHLASGEEDHMPPEGKRQLKLNEIQILERWIALGASDTLHLDQLDSTEPLKTLVRVLMAPDPLDKWKKLPKLEDSTLQQLSTDYRTVRRIVGNSDALSIDVYLSPVYDPSLVTDLARVASNIVELDLSGLPLGSRELELVATCRNLEWLEVDRTPISDGDMNKLDGLPNLRLLKLYETDIGDAGITSLAHLDRLDEIYLWKTRITDDGLEWLKKTYPKLSVNTGISPQEEAFFTGSDSIPVITEPATP